MNKDEANRFITMAKIEGKKYQTKEFKTAELQSFTDGQNGTISGYFSTFDHDHGDSAGDVIRKGAFTETIARRKQSGHPFPFCFNHDFSTIIGRVIEIGEDNKGAYFTAEFFPTEKAQEIRAIVKSGVLWQFSFAYNTLESGPVTAGDGSRVNELRKLDLIEISIVVSPANPRATITDIKDSKEETRKNLLNMIDRIEMEKTAEEPCRGHDLATLKKMEEQAMKDIGAATLAHDTEWKDRRRSALAAIRKEISRIEKQKK